MGGLTVPVSVGEAQDDRNPQERTATLQQPPQNPVPRVASARISLRLVGDNRYREKTEYGESSSYQSDHSHLAEGLLESTISGKEVTKKQEGEKRVATPTRGFLYQNKGLDHDHRKSQ